MKKNINKIEALKELKTDATPSAIRAALRELNEYTEADMADVLGCTRAYISQHIKGHRHNKKIQSGIAALFQVPEEEIF